MDKPITVTPSELASALEQWERDAEANGWDKRTDAHCHVDTANYLIHTIRLARGEGDPAKQEG